MIRLAVAVCTWNRAPMLDRMLSEMRKLRVPAGVDWELLVVNNNCSDNTDEVIARHTNDLPIRRLFEPKQGLSNARNCATQAATGDLLIWTDDDVLVDSEWLAAYAEGVRRWPNAVYFGGLIAPLYEERPPAYIVKNEKELEGVLVIRDFGPVERPFQGEEAPFGANMAFRRVVFEKWQFDPKLGRHGNAALLGEETALLRQLRGSGSEGIWLPAAKVRHFVPGTRTTPAYIWSYGVGYGRTFVRTYGLPQGKAIWGAPRWMYRAYWSRRSKALLQRLTGQTSWAVTYYDAAATYGMIVESRAMTRD